MRIIITKILEIIKIILVIIVEAHFKMNLILKIILTILKMKTKHFIMKDIK